MTVQPPNRRPPGARSEELGVYEMLWDCKFCGATALPAKTHKFCPTCGAAQDPRSRRFPADDEKRAVTDYVPAGADVICKACGGLNAGNAKFCKQCGASLEGAEAAALTADQVRGEGETFAAQAQRDLSAERHAAEMRRVGVVKDEKKQGGFPWWIAAVVLVIAIVGGIIWALTAERDAVAIVTGHTWERAVYVEEFSAVPDAAWCEAVPPGAYSVSSRREIRDYNRVPDGEDCQIRRRDNGDGTFREVRECTPLFREEPIYDDRCYFTINRWTDERVARAQGAALSPAPAWPVVDLDTCSSARLGCERESGRAENYYLQLRSDDQDFRCEVTAATWSATRIEAAFTLQIGTITGVPDCASLTPR